MVKLTNEKQSKAAEAARNGKDRSAEWVMQWICSQTFRIPFHGDFGSFVHALRRRGRPASPRKLTRGIFTSGDVSGRNINPVLAFSFFSFFFSRPCGAWPRWCVVLNFPTSQDMKWSAGWGSACDPCAKAKTRCIRPDGDNDATCNRCRNLKTTCAQQVRKPRKKRRRRTSLTSQDLALPPLVPQNGGIYGTPSSTQSRGPSLFPTQGTTTTANADPVNGEAEPEPNVYVASVKAERTGVYNVGSWLPGFYRFPSPPCTCLNEADGDDVTEPPESDEALLAIYRRRLSPQFPFVVVPDDLSATELQRTRPFLAKSIRMVASLKNRRSMWNQSRLLLRHISDSMFMRPDKSLDLLQGIIVFLGFYHYFCIAHGHFNHLTHLASSLIADMRLDRPTARPPTRKGHPRGMNPEEPRAMLNDERRAILAVWYMNSCSAEVFRKVNSPGRHFTEHMQRQLQELEDRLEYETDEILVQLVRGQRTNEMISQLQLNDQSVDIQPSSDLWAANLDSLLAELEKKRDHETQHKTPRCE
ncbi:hypothetical protein NLU13_1746 [Sarocladium strictum]|uniref:Zn(2)-C6 fungal-type domain-containing protein n=1 Tax=Sarocladium strictum TaxID=5046 RepID=A0AA39GRJ3_SARSR|nr:hypothetical protein NLU13_1746 [Sarocladium strictum]